MESGAWSCRCRYCRVSPGPVLVPVPPWPQGLSLGSHSSPGPQAPDHGYRCWEERDQAAEPGLKYWRVYWMALDYSPHSSNLHRLVFNYLLWTVMTSPRTQLKQTQHLEGHGCRAPVQLHSGPTSGPKTRTQRGWDEERTDVMRDAQM